MFYPSGVTTDRFSNLYIAVGPTGEIYASGYGGLFRVWQDGTFRLVVRTGSYSGDGGPAIEAGLDGLFGAAIDDAGNVYVAGLHVRKITPSGIISTIAGTGRYDYSGDGGPALGASFAGSGAIAVGSGGVIYVADIFNHAIRELRPMTGGGRKKGRCRGTVARHAGDGVCTIRDEERPTHVFAGSSAT